MLKLTLTPLENLVQHLIMGHYVKCEKCAKGRLLNRIENDEKVVDYYSCGCIVPVYYKHVVDTNNLPKEDM